MVNLAELVIPPKKSRTVKQMLDSYSAPGGDGDPNSKAVQAVLNKYGLTKNVKYVKDVVCKAGWTGPGCMTPCTNAKRYEHYSGDGCAVTKCKVDLKLGYSTLPATSIQ